MSASDVEEDRARHAPDPLAELVHHAELPQTRLSSGIDRAIRWMGSAVSWIWLVLIGVIVVNVVMRYAFGEGRIEFEEIQWHLYSIGFLFGLAYCLQADDHVRVDLFYERFRLRTKAWVELVGILAFLVPFIVLIVVYAWPFVAYSYGIDEISEAPGGLPYRWLIKSALPIAFILLGLATLSRLARVTACLFGFPRPLRAGSE